MAGKKYGTLDEVLTEGTGLNKKERGDWRATVKHWQAIRRNAKKGSKKHVEAVAEINRLMGW